MEVIAKARHIRMSPRKVRLIADLVRGMDVEKATNQLRFFRKAAARPVLKVILSAVANAEHNFKMAPASLFVKYITVDGGPVLHRWRARAFGRAAPIKKRSAHITVILDERPVVSEKVAGISAAVVEKQSTKASPAKTAAAKGKTSRKKASATTKTKRVKKA